MEGKTASVTADLSWKSRDDGNGASKLVTNLLDPDGPGMENGIPLSPQWLQPKPPGELTPRSGLHFDPSVRETPRGEGGREERRTWRNDRWRDEGRDNSSHLTRRERYDPGETRRMDRWGDPSEGRRNDRWNDRDSGYDARREKWSTRWGPEDKERDRRDKWVEPDKEGEGRERQPNNPINTRENENERGIWIPPHARRTEAPPPLGNTPPKNAPGFGRGRGGDRFSVGRGRSYGSYPSYQSNHIGDKPEARSRADGGYRYPRAKLLDIYKSCSNKLPDGFIEVDELTVEEPVEPLAVSAPDDEEELVLEAIQKGDIIGSGAAKDLRGNRDEPRRPRFRKDDNLKDDDALGLLESEHASRTKSHGAKDPVRRREEELNARDSKETRNWEDEMDPYKEDQSWKSSVRKEQPKRPEDLELYYTDPQGAVQGPFMGSDIIGWFEAGYFNIELPVRVADAPESVPFVPLGTVMPHLKPKARVPPGFNVKVEESPVTGLRMGLENLHVDTDPFLARKRMVVQARQPDSNVFPANWPHEVPSTEPVVPARSEVMVTMSDREWPHSAPLQQDVSQLQLQQELLYQPPSPLPQRSSSGHFLEQLHPGSNAQQQAEHLLKMRQQQQQQQLLQRQQLQQQLQQPLSHPALLLQQANYDFRLPNVVEARARQQEMDLLAERAALRSPTNPLDHLAHLKLQHESAFRQFFPDERQLMRQASMPQRPPVDENRMSGVWELDDYSQFVRSVAPTQVVDAASSMDDKRSLSHGDMAGNTQVLDSLQRLYSGSGMQKDAQLDRSLSVGRMPVEFRSEQVGAGYTTADVGIEFQLQQPQPQPQEQQHQPPRKIPENTHIATSETINVLVPPSSESPRQSSVMTGTVLSAVENMDTSTKLPDDREHRNENETVVSSWAPQVPQPPVVKEIQETDLRSKVVTQTEEVTATAPSKIDDSDFIEPKEVKKNKKRAKNKLNKSAAIAAVEVVAPKATAPTPKQNQDKEVLPSPPPGPSLADFMVMKEEPVTPQPFPAWSVDRQVKPAKSLKEIQEAERQAREEQERKLKQQQLLQLQLQQQQQAAQKPLVPRSTTGSAWQKSAPAPAQTGTKAKSKFEDEDDLFWDYEDVKPAGKSDRHEQGKVTAKPPSGFRQAAGATGPVSAPNSVSDFPSLSSSSKTASSARKPVGKIDVPPVNPEAKAFRQWCESQMKRLTGNDDMTLLEFCVSLPSPTEAGEYLTHYLGSNSNVQTFKSEFLQRKEMLSMDALRSVFNVSAAVVSDAHSKGGSFYEKKKVDEGEFEESKAGKKKAKKGKKVVDPSLLGFSVTSNRILMGEIQHVED